MNASITDFQAIRPQYQCSQAHSLEWIARAHAFSESQRDPRKTEAEHLERMRRLVKRYGCSSAHISGRGHDIGDFLHHDWERMELYQLVSAPDGPGTAHRNSVFQEISDRKLEAFYQACEPPPPHLLHVSCTGYAAPSAAQKLVDARGWNEDTTVTHVYHMGCAAAFPALRVARGLMLLSKEGSPIDVVHTELCSLHLDPANHQPEQWVIQSLFADGHIRYRVTSPRELEQRPRAALEIVAMHEEILPNSAGAMGWSLGDHGMRMALAATVPALIGLHLEKFLARLFARASVPLEQVLPKAVFAIHPGGPRIIDQIGTTFHSTELQMKASRGVFTDFGNMSSATLPHVWQRVLEDPEVRNGAWVISLAFAPGLTVTGALFRKVTP